MHDPANVTDELVDVRHAHLPPTRFVANIDNLLCLQDMETRQRNLLTPEPLASSRVPTLVIWGTPEPLRRRARGPAMHEHIPGTASSCTPSAATGPSTSRPTCTTR